MKCNFSKYMTCYKKVCYPYQAGRHEAKMDCIVSLRNLLVSSRMGIEKETLLDL